MTRPVVSRTATYWIADRDGVAHARSHLRGPRTACGIPAVPERHSWPATSRCPTCIAVIAEVEATA